jgi:hypothetical protein
MENSKKVFIEQFQDMLDYFDPITTKKKHNNYILMFITKKYKYLLLMIITYYIYKNYGYLKKNFYKLLQHRT